MSVRFAALSNMLFTLSPPNSNCVYVCTSASMVCFLCSLRTLSIALIFFKSSSVIVLALTAPSQLIGRARMLFCREEM